MSSRKRGSVRVRSRQQQQGRRQWIGFSILLVMTLSVIIAVMLAIR